MCWSLNFFEEYISGGSGEQTRVAIQHLSSGKAQGADAIPVEVYKAGGLPTAEKDSVVSMHVEKGGYPTSIRGCIHLYKRKVKKSSSLLQLSIAGKILAKFY